MENKLISFIIAAYNVEPYLLECIESINKQPLAVKCEVIVVDDGSTDKTKSISLACAEKYANVKVISKKNGGVSSARNIGLESSSGEYVWFIDGDDCIAPDAISAITKQLEKGPVALKFGYANYSLTTQGWQTSGCFGIYIKEATITGLEATRQTLLGNLAPSCWSIVINRQHLEKSKSAFLPYKQAEDLLWSINTLIHLNNIKIINKPLYWYRQRDDSVSYTFSETHIKSVFAVLTDLYTTSADVFHSKNLSYWVCFWTQLKQLVDNLIAHPQVEVLKTFTDELETFCSDKNRQNNFKCHLTPYIITSANNILIKLATLDGKNSKAIQAIEKYCELPPFSSPQYIKVIKDSTTRWKKFLARIKN